MTEWVFFDAGNTLIYSDPQVGEVLVRLCADQGFEASPEMAQKGYQEADREYTRFILSAREAGREPDPDECTAFWQNAFYAAAGLPEDESFRRRINEAFFNVQWRWERMPGAEEVLRWLKSRGTRTGVISNFDTSLPRVLDEVGLAEHLDFIIASQEVGVSKPERGIFDLALARAGVPASRAMHVGDHPFDIVGARGVGLPVVWLTARASHRVDPSEPDYVIGSLLELRGILEDSAFHVDTTRA